MAEEPKPEETNEEKMKEIEIEIDLIKGKKRQQYVLSVSGRPADQTYNTSFPYLAHHLLKLMTRSAEIETYNLAFTDRARKKLWIEDNMSVSVLESMVYLANQFNETKNRIRSAKTVLKGRAW